MTGDRTQHTNASDPAEGPGRGASAPAPQPLDARTLAAHLAGCEDADLAALLARRPDLASPAPSSLLALAARAATRASVERALAGLDGTAVAVAEALVALAPLGDATVAGLARATGLDETAVTEVLGDLEALALTLRGRPLPALAEAYGPHPAGLGPTLRDLDAAAPARGSAEAPDLTGAPPAARATLEAMLWGPPVGTTRGETLPDGAAWLVENAVLARPDSQRVALPRETALALRGGRTHRDAPAPPSPTVAHRAPEAIAAESSQSATAFLRDVATLLGAWREHPAAVLRSGGVGVRETKRTAAALGVDEGRVALVAEAAAAAGLLWRSETEPLEWGPSRAADDWLEAPAEHRWVTLALGWLGTARTPWTAGTRDAAGTLRAVLGPQLDAPWAPRVRAQALGLLAAHPTGAVSAEDVAATIAFHQPRLPSHDAEIPHVLAEFAALGLTGAGAISPGALVLARGGDGAEAAVAFAETLPRPVDELIVQGDLTAIVPGPPTVPLRCLLTAAADVESTGSALTARFSTASVRRALDAGWTAEQLLDDLRSYSRGPLPQPLEYLVGDVARRHGQVRLAAAGTVLHSRTPEATAALLGDPRLADLALRRVAEGVLLSPESPDVVARALRVGGHAPVLEDETGAAVPSGRAATHALGGGPVPGGRAGRRRGRRDTDREPTFPGRTDLTAPGVDARTASGGAVGATPADPRAMVAVVARARAGDAAVRRAADAARDQGVDAATDPVVVLEALRSAMAARARMDVVLVGAGGDSQQRTVVPTSVESGRVRMRDVHRDVDITVAVPRIASAVPARDVEPPADRAR